MIKAVGFDLGDTLIEYQDVPLNWEAFYEKALICVLEDLDVEPSKKMITMAKGILSKYNTRRNPRDYEISAEVIWNEILDIWGLKNEENLGVAINGFYSYFQRRKVVFDDVLDTIEALADKGVKLGVLSDVPYGMTKNFVLRCG